MKYIIVQAGGKGTRLGYLTRNKPKALVPVENLPMLFHLFRKYSDSNFLVIADYKKDVLRKYLESFSKVRYQLIEAYGTGTVAGIKQAMDLIPFQEPFMLIWSDLILPQSFQLPAEYQPENKILPKKNYIGISETFPCRWKYKDGEFMEEDSTECGVAGFFLIHNKTVMEGIPESGELLRWMQEQSISFEKIGLAGTREIGLLENYEKLEHTKCRPFNRIIVNGNVLIKEPIDNQGEALAEREGAWYEKAKEKNLRCIPRIYKTTPIEMEYIDGKNVYECTLPIQKKQKLLVDIVDMLKQIHESEQVAADSFSIKEAYYTKTMRRLAAIEDLIPFGRERYIRINGRNCRNIYYYKDRLEKELEKLRCENFHFIHGDCTFSNILVRDNGQPVLIDPRGYFGYTKFYGDERYDWAKIYYSIIGNYDQFNLKNFQLLISEEEVRLSVDSNGWEILEEDFFAMTEMNRNEIKLLHAVIWLSLTTYAWQDYDSICGAFYNGLYYLEEIL